MDWVKATKLKPASKLTRVEINELLQILPRVLDVVLSTIQFVFILIS